MNVFDLLALLGGMSLFLFGISIVGASLEKITGRAMQSRLKRLCKNKTTGFLTGCAVTAVVQSSSAVTAMIVELTGVGALTLSQALTAIMGANVGTTATAWLLALEDFAGRGALRLPDAPLLAQMLAASGIALLLFSGRARRKDAGMALLGFATLLLGLQSMTDSAAGLLALEPVRAFLAASDPLAGLAVGAALTAVVQSSSASVGMLQALAATGRLSFSAAIPIVLGQNIGTCATALLASAGGGANAKRAAIGHLCFNLLGTGAVFALFCLLRSVGWSRLAQPISRVQIAAAHTAFNLFAAALLLPQTQRLERLLRRLVPAAQGKTRKKRALYDM